MKGWQTHLRRSISLSSTLGFCPSMLEVYSEHHSKPQKHNRPSRCPTDTLKLLHSRNSLSFRPKFGPSHGSSHDQVPGSSSFLDRRARSQALDSSTWFLESRFQICSMLTTSPDPLLYGGIHSCSDRDVDMVERTSTPAGLYVLRIKSTYVTCRL